MDHYKKDMYPGAASGYDHKKYMHDLCTRYIGQNIELETTDGVIHHGTLHSYDNENLYLLMRARDGENYSGSERIFPGFGFGFPGFFPGFGLWGFPFWGIRRFGPFFPFWW
ncbi:hypothetical protein [Fictibacillus gelatini]|uniref:hypothetical protein n=1 Tax=Fictibacillus gelatini TaxID=225985 RepID=UPI00041B8C03|nr:hypothetical protein [Fictibacillus gelatini]